MLSWAIWVVDHGESIGDFDTLLAVLGSFGVSVFAIACAVVDGEDDLVVELNFM